MHCLLSPRAALRFIALSLLAGALPSQATTCTAVAGAIAFGLYDTVQSTPNDTTGTLQVTCTPGATDAVTTAYTVTIAGTGTGSDSVRSVWAGGAYRLYYQVYKEVGRSTVWGNGGSSGSGVVSSVTSTAVLVPALRSHTVYARMPALQAVPAALYVGGLLVTIDY